MLTLFAYVEPLALIAQKKYLHTKMSISGGDQQLQMGVGEGMPPPLPPNQVRDWHASITPDLRTHFVLKLARAIFPNPDPAAVRERIQDVLRYARNVEKGMFEAANNKEGYFHMVLEKVHELETELQEARNRRLNEAQLAVDGI